VDSMTDQQRGTFRYDVAGMIKSLVRLRNHVTPTFFDVDEKRQWDVPDPDPDYKLEYKYVINWVWKRYQALYTQYRNLTPQDMLEVWNLVITFFGHAPKGWGKFIATDPPIDRLVLWPYLPQLRKMLDQLPHPKPEPKETPEEYWASCGYEGWALCPHCKTPMYKAGNPEASFLGTPRQITRENFDLANSTPIGRGRVQVAEIICSSCAGEILIDLHNHCGLSREEAKTRMGW